VFRLKILHSVDARFAPVICVQDDNEYAISAQVHHK